MLLLWLFLPHASYAKIVFNEVAWMGTAASQFGEWVEFFNDGDAEVDLEGAVLSEGGGSVATFTLTKKIAPHGYYLVERTTATSPDPVPERNDDAGSFGGSGFSNSGESLVLKDASGTVLAVLDASLGWPAGDSSTKETMQWNGTAWVTAAPTPGGPTTGVSIVVPEAASSSPSSSSEASTGTSSPLPSAHVSGASIAPVIKESDPLLVQAGRDRLGFVGVPLVFTGKGFVGGGDSLVRNPSFAWSFGDGGFATGMVVEHAFEFPGEYVVVLNGSWGEEISTARSKVTIVSPSLRITKIERGARPFIEVTNTSSFEVNLWKAALRAGFFSFSFPADTIIAPGASVSFAKSITGLDPKEGDEVVLLWPGGRVSSAVTIPREEEKKEYDVAELERTVASLHAQIQEAGKMRQVSPEPRRPVQVARLEEKIVVKRDPLLASSTAVRVIEIPKPGQASAEGVFSLPSRALAFIGGLIFGK